MGTQMLNLQAAEAALRATIRAQTKVLSERLNNTTTIRLFMQRYTDTVNGVIKEIPAQNITAADSTVLVATVSNWTSDEKNCAVAAQAWPYAPGPLEFIIAYVGRAADGELHMFYGLPQMDAGTHYRTAAGAETVDDQLPSAGIADLAVTTGKIDNLAVTEGKIGPLAVTEGKIGPLAVTEGKIGPLAVTEGKIGALAVTNGKIGTGAVTTSKIADEQVSFNHMFWTTVDNVTITTIEQAIDVANELRYKMNAHGASGDVAPLGGHHIIPDAANFPVAGALPTTLATLITTVNALIASYVPHNADAMLAAAWVYHRAQTADHTLASDVAPTNLTECIARLTDIRAKYNAHDAEVATHGGGSFFQVGHAAPTAQFSTQTNGIPYSSMRNNLDVELSINSIESCIRAVNDLFTIYVIHIQDIAPAGSDHLIADVVNVPGVNLAIDEASLYAAIADLQNVIDGHVEDACQSAGWVYHNNAAQVWTQRRVTLPAPTTLETAIAALTELRQVYNTHDNSGAPVHGVAATHPLQYPAPTSFPETSGGHVRFAKTYFDVAVHGGVTAAGPAGQVHALDLRLPAMAVVKRAFAQVPAGEDFANVDAAATIEIGAVAQGDLIAAQIVPAAAFYDGVPVETVATNVVTVAGPVTLFANLISAAASPFTAGRMVIWVEYFLAE